MPEGLHHIFLEHGVAASPLVVSHPMMGILLYQSEKAPYPMSLHHLAKTRAVHSVSRTALYKLTFR
jgi:hypothetical protein